MEPKLLDFQLDAVSTGPFSRFQIDGPLARAEEHIAFHFWVPVINGGVTSVSTAIAPRKKGGTSQVSS